MQATILVGDDTRRRFRFRLVLRIWFLISEFPALAPGAFSITEHASIRIGGFHGSPRIGYGLRLPANGIVLSRTPGLTGFNGIASL